MAESLLERNEWVGVLKTFAQPEVLGYSNATHFCYRLDRTFWLRVIDARNIGQCDPYCFIELDGERRAKTSTKSRTNAPFWREDFYFSISLNNIKRGEYYEEWYPLMHEAKNSHAAEHVGDIRLRLRYDEVVVLPSASYEELIEMILDVESKIIFDLVGISKNLEWFSENMTRIYEGRNYAIEWLTYLAYHEVNSTGNAIYEVFEVVQTLKRFLDDSNILFRGNSILTKAIDSYMKMIGIQYVDEAIGDIVRSICEHKIVCEVDMTKLEKGQDIRSQWRILLTYTKMLWRAIEKSRAKCPSLVYLRMLGSIRSPSVTDDDDDNVYL
ncbi:Rho GTPase activation protein [Basidiobolus meristosporus CBS 931.73]|uniref:Rho GTPase activation protein n=1 Tax=Basidiobolus meristosporus CBS 931.73 TaxID=1314790 RepID=A0A1Y1XSM3_9FUNG|nr:Rho GTPase activation protein [Basidiobolus meristosporus CBS 931.73]|eukprot:ORX88741.1 Rho GTPase activation protein [Basidiobolus meristosporus CBS 931.73]